jgi:hypothetical protein
LSYSKRESIRKAVSAPRVKVRLRTPATHFLGSFQGTSCSPCARQRPRGAQMSDVSQAGCRTWAGARVSVRNPRTFPEAQSRTGKCSEMARSSPGRSTSTSYDTLKNCCCLMRKTGLPHHGHTQNRNLQPQAARAKLAHRDARIRMHLPPLRSPAC